MCSFWRNFFFFFLFRKGDRTDSLKKTKKTTECSFLNLFLSVSDQVHLPSSVIQKCLTTEHHRHFDHWALSGILIWIRPPHWKKFVLFSTVFFFYNLIQYFEGHSCIHARWFHLLLLHDFFSTICFVLLCVNGSHCVLRCLFALVLYWEIVINLAVRVTWLCTIFVFCMIFLHKLYKYFKCALQIKLTGFFFSSAVYYIMIRLDAYLTGTDIRFFLYFPSATWFRGLLGDSRKSFTFTRFWFHLPGFWSLRKHLASNYSLGKDKRINSVQMY